MTLPPGTAPRTGADAKRRVGAGLSMDDFHAQPQIRCFGVAESCHVGTFFATFVVIRKTAKPRIKSSKR